MAFSRTVTIAFADADPAGIIFYGRLLGIAHRVFEEFTAAELVGRWEAWYSNGEWITPVRHTECDFHRPLRPGRQYDAELVVSKLGESSFEITTRFFEHGGADRRPCAETRVVHVFAHPSRFEKLPIPASIRGRLEAHLARE